jgi:hypothetical protein
MTDIVMLQAAMFQLRAALESIDDPFLRTQATLATNVLSNAVDAAANGVNAAAVNDIAFAMNDVAAAAADTPEIEPAVAMLQRDVDALKAATALPEEVIAAARALQSKLKIRKTAIERQTYVENASDPLPHEPQELRADALPLRDRLLSAGFATPALDVLITDPAALRFHSINDIVDELDVIIAS